MIPFHTTCAEQPEINPIYRKNFIFGGHVVMGLELRCISLLFSGAEMEKCPSNMGGIRWSDQILCGWVSDVDFPRGA